MVTTDELTKWREMLQSTFPILGKMRRKRAIEALHPHRNEPEVVPLLAEALALSDPEVSGQAEAALDDLTAQPAIDALGAAWAKGRNPRLGRFLAQRGYVARQPLSVMVLTVLKCGKRIQVDRADVVPLLLRLTNDPDETVRAGAVASLEHVSPGPASEALCDEAMKQPASPAAQLCLRKGIRPRDHERLCLFLFVTRQLDAYFQEDFEFQNLRPQYDRADAVVHAHVMEVVRSGDRRCLGFFGTRAKPFPECSEPEIKLALDTCLRHQDWSRLFQACLELPMKYAYPALKRLGQSDWQPEPADLRSVHKQILADVSDHELPPPKQPGAASPLFEQWLARGQSGELAALDETALAQRLNTAIPPDGVAIVAALAAKKSLSPATMKAVEESPHWLVRLAGQAAGMSHDLTRDTVEDSNYWINELASATGVLDFWPGEATAPDLEKLSAAPQEAWTGKLGSVRKVLRTVMTHRIAALRTEAKEKWRPASGETEAAEEVRDVSIAEPPPVPKKPKRIFDV